LARLLSSCWAARRDSPRLKIPADGKAEEVA
jgi:hypothetical protein